MRNFECTMPAMQLCTMATVPGRARSACGSRNLRVSDEPDENATRRSRLSQTSTSGSSTPPNSVTRMPCTAWHEGAARTGSAAPASAIKANSSAALRMVRRLLCGRARDADHENGDVVAHGLAGAAPSAIDQPLRERVRIGRFLLDPLHRTGCLEQSAFRIARFAQTVRREHDRVAVLELDGFYVERLFHNAEDGAGDGQLFHA